MEELHSNEQYFFDAPTTEYLADFLLPWRHPCCLCCPTLGQMLEKLGRSATILDVDERFRGTKGFLAYDLYRPQWLKQEFDIIVCDPPFFKLALSGLFAAIRVLSRNNFSQPLLVSYLKRRETAILGTFAKFNLRPTGIRPGYQTVKKCQRNDIEWYSNLSQERFPKPAYGICGRQ